MSRTYRKNHSYFRKPKVQNERKQISKILSEVQSEEYQVSGINHLKQRLNVSDFEVYNSSYYQDYEN